MATTKELMDYEKAIWEYEKTIKPKEVAKSNNNKTNNK